MITVNRESRSPADKQKPSDRRGSNCNELNVN